jgi:hypothetical protein
MPEESVGLQQGGNLQLFRASFASVPDLRLMTRHGKLELRAPVTLLIL